MTIIAKILLVVVAALGLMSLQNSLCGKKRQRSRLLVMIPIALVYSIGFLVWWEQQGNLVVMKYLQLPLMKDSDIALANIILMAGFTVIKLFLRPIVSAFWRKPSLLELTALDFYSYDDQYSEWFLKNKWANFRKLIFWLMVVICVICGVIPAVSWVVSRESAWWVPTYPCAALVILVEFYGYINGDTKEEFEHSVGGDEIEGRRISDFFKLREILEQLIPEPLLTVNSGCDFSSRESSNELLRDMNGSADPADRATAEYFLAGGRYRTADADSVYATRSMMHRKNVVFLNPFYRDLEMYVTLPMVSALLSGKKVLVICGRNSEAENILTWTRSFLAGFSRIDSLWRVEFLTEIEEDIDVGVMTASQIYDKRILNANQALFVDTDFVLITEPSLILSTSQVGLSIVAQELNQNGNAVFCICDRDTDGLVDTMSHLLRSEITEVVAMPVPRCTYTAMAWDADGDFHGHQLLERQSRNLVSGIEIAATAIKNQIPKVSWISGSKIPMKDTKWISGQNYHTLCKYMNIPIQQKSFYEKIDFVSDMWGIPQTRENFCVVEDEFCNFFSMLRAFLSRGKDQSFVNILSENYLLRDYMRCNQRMFISNPNAIPSCVADYAKTERNTLIKLLIMMSIHPVTDAEILSEFRLAGIDTTEPFSTLLEFVRRYSFVDDSIFTVKSIGSLDGHQSMSQSYCYSISSEMFNAQFADTLKSAYFILEEEKDDVNYIDARLFNHVVQLVLPNQFVTYEGKYYMVKYVSPESGVVLRRASHLLDGRKYYRQIRNYRFTDPEPAVVSTHKIMDVEFTELSTDFCVETTGYLEMNANHDLRRARVVDFSEDPDVSSYVRSYKNKSVLKIKLPNADHKIRFTICLLLSEIFRTVYPDSWQYLAVLTDLPKDIGGMLSYVVYSSDGLLDDDCIYIVEDSVLDMGLLSSVEKNFHKYMEILADFLDWHLGKMREPYSKDPVPEKISVVKEQEKKKRKLIVSMLDRIRKLFGGKKEEEVTIKDPPDSSQNGGEKVPEKTEPTEPVTETGTDDGKTKAAGIAPASEPSGHAEAEPKENPPEKLEDAAAKAEKLEQELHPEDEFEPAAEEDPDIAAIDGTDIFDSDGLPEHNDYLEAVFAKMGISALTRTRYQEECYLKFGFDEIDSRIQADEVFRYLRVHGWGNNSLKKARKADNISRTQMDTKAVNHCDFCGKPLSGVSYDKLPDGRVRCSDCASSAIATEADLREVFFLCLQMQESLFNIHFGVPIRVRMADAKTIARSSGMIFTPTSGVAPRVLGYAMHKDGVYSLMMENGSPRLAALDTMVHEMTHIWQYTNWDKHQISSIYGMHQNICSARATDIVYEGMALWASVQYLYLIGEQYYASQAEDNAASRSDVYGLGFRLYRDRYPLVKDSGSIKLSPFNSFPPLDPEDVFASAKQLCTEQKCKC